jgi:hypothetical protein
LTIQRGSLVELALITNACGGAELQQQQPPQPSPFHPRLVDKEEGVEIAFADDILVRRTNVSKMAWRLNCILKTHILTRQKEHFLVSLLYQTSQPSSVLHSRTQSSSNEPNYDNTISTPSAFEEIFIATKVYSRKVVFDFISSLLWKDFLSFLF